MGLRVDGNTQLNADTGQVPQALTAPTAQILFDNNVIGAIQNINASVDYNVKTVDEIGNALTARFVPGVLKITGSAQRAFVTADIFFDLLPAALLQQGTPSLSQYFGITNTSIVGTAVLGTLDTYVGKVVASASNNILNSTSTSRLTQFKQVLASQALNYIQSQALFFDIQMNDNYGNNVHTLRDTIISAREISMDVSGIIMMTNLSFMSRLLV